MTHNGTCDIVVHLSVHSWLQGTTPCDHVWGGIFVALPVLSARKFPGSDIDERQTFSQLTNYPQSRRVANLQPVRSHAQVHKINNACIHRMYIYVHTALACLHVVAACLHQIYAVLFMRSFMNRLSDSDVPFTYITLWCGCANERNLWKVSTCGL